MRTTHESGTGVARRGRAAAAARWWLAVATDDPVRQVRLSGLLLMLPPMALGMVAIALCLRAPEALVLAVLVGLCALPTRRGSSTGAVALVALTALGVGLGVAPEAAAGPPLVLLFPALLAALALPPGASVLAAAATVAALALRAWLDGLPSVEALALGTTGIYTMVVIALPVLLLAWLCGRALRAQGHAQRDHVAAMER